MTESTQIVLAIVGAALTAAGLCWTILQTQIGSIKELLKANLNGITIRLDTMDRSRNETRGELKSMFDRFMVSLEQLQARYESLDTRLKRIEIDLEHRCPDCPAFAKMRRDP